MLSIQPLKSAQGAVDYYTAAFNYYAGDATAIRWMGQGSEILKLGSVVEKEQMLALLQGNVPNGQKLQNPKGEHRPGFDMTFSAPKSVSVLVGLGVAPNLIQFHDEAVDRAVKQIEAEFAEARVLKDGVIQFEKTGNLTIAAFRQPSSRGNDPALHTHCVTMNMTFLDGRAKSLSSDIHGQHGVVEQLQRSASYAGLLYRHHLANLLKQDGYSLRLAGDGLFEIDGLPKDVLQHFSQRRAEIERLMKEKGWEGAKAASSAAVLSREDKEEMDLNVLEREWAARATELGFDAQAFVDNRHEFQAKTSRFQAFKEKISDAFYQPVDRKKQDAQVAVTVAIETLSQKTSVFSERELITESLKHTLLSERVVTQNAIHEAIGFKKQEQSLYEARCPYSNKPQLTTPWLLTLEAETIARIDANKGVVPAIATKKDVEAFQQSSEKTLAYPLTRSQKQAMLSLLTSEDRFIAIQGYAGVAKTTMLNVAREMITDKGYSIRGITVASSAANEMRRKAGIRCDVFPMVHGELKRAKDNSLQKTVFIVDEASMLSSPQGHELARLVEQKGARLCFVGDDAQLPSVKNGRTFGLIQDYDVHTSVMDEIVRQDNQQAKESVEHATRGEVYDALAKLQEVKELDTHEARIEHMANAWLNLTTDVRKQTLLFAPTHANRADITTIIRDGLEKEGTLTGVVWKHTVLRARALEDIQQRFAGHYEEGNVIRFNQDFKRNNITNGDYLTVGHITATHRRDNVLPLLRDDGRALSFQLKQLPEYKTHTAGFSRIMEIYQTSELEIMQGDTLLWCRNFKRDGIHNSERATVLSLDDKSFNIRLDNGEQISLDKQHAALKHVDHGYVFTNFKVQGKDARFGMGLIESYHRFSATVETFYVQISRAVRSMTLVTDDKNNLVRALELNDSQKKSAIDAISANQLYLHASRFKNDKHLTLDSVIDKKSIKEGEWTTLENHVDTYQSAKRLQSKVHAALSAQRLLSSPEGIRLANSRMGFGFQTYRRDAMTVASLRLMKGLNDEEKQHFNTVKQYVSLNQDAAAAWKSVRNNPALAIISGTREKAAIKSSQRDTLASVINDSIEQCRPFLTHFSIGDLNRFGVPQFRYTEEGGMAVKRLDKLGEQAARHQFGLLVNRFFEQPADESRGLWACEISEHSKAAHSFILARALKTEQVSTELWREVRDEAREFNDQQFRQTLPRSQVGLFDEVKQYKALSFKVGQAWKAAFNEQVNGTVLSPEKTKPIDQLNLLKHKLAHDLTGSAQDHQAIFSYFKIDSDKLSRQTTLHKREKHVGLFLKPAMPFNEKMAAAKLIAEDIKGYYPLIKKMGIDLSRLNRFMALATRHELLSTLTKAEQLHYKQVSTYQHVAKKTAKAWKACFDAKQQQKPTRASMNQALELSARRDAMAFKIQDIALYGLALNKEAIAIPRLQEHAKNHHDRLREIKHLQESQHGQLSQLENQHAVMNTQFAQNWQAQWRETNQQIKAVEKNTAYQVALKEYPLTRELSEPVSTLINALSEKSSPPKTTQTTTHQKQAVLHMDAAPINDALMVNPESTYRAIFGEPKKISGNVIEYPAGLKVTIKGAKAGLWNHFGEAKGGAPIQAIMFARDLNFKDALTVAAELLGMHSGDVFPVKQGRFQPEIMQTESNKLAIQSANSIWKGTIPLTRSLAEKYLKTHRGITDTSTLNDLRFWPIGAQWQKVDTDGKLVESINKLPVLVIAARNADNNISAVQRIYLDKNTANKNQFMQAAKLSSGVMKGSAGIIQKGDKHGRLYITEGPETGASVALAHPNSTVLVSFSVSNMRNLSSLVMQFKPTDVILAADHDVKKDGSPSQTRITTENAAIELRNNGIATTVIYPKLIHGTQKTDWNDVLIKEGIESVRKQLEVNIHEIKSKDINIKQPDLRLPKQTIPANYHPVLDVNSFDKHQKTALIYDRMDSFDSSKSKAITLARAEQLNQINDYHSMADHPSISSDSMGKVTVKLPEKTFVKEMEI